MFLVLLASLPAGCSSSHLQVPGTDIPRVPHLELINIQTIEGSKSQMTKGKAIFEGTIFDALERIRWSTANFEHSGWTLESVTGTPQKATGIFFKNSKDGTVTTQRIATLVVTANRRKGTAVVEFSTRPKPVATQSASKPESEKASGTGADDSEGSSSEPAGSS